MTMLSNYSLYFYVSTHRFVLLSTRVWKDSFGSGSMQRFTLVKVPSIDNNEVSIVSGSSVSIFHQRRLEEHHERGERRNIRNRVGRGIDKMLISGHNGYCIQNHSCCVCLHKTYSRTGRSTLQHEGGVQEQLPWTEELLTADGGWRGTDSFL